jgi:hypothetical protein
MENRKVTIMSEWISVKERLPKYGQQVLAFDCIEDCVDVMSFEPEENNCPEGWYTSSWWHRDEDDVTHWMPLPEPPMEDRNVD